MTHPNLDLISRFFAAYGNRDMDALRQILTDDVKWIFPGDHPLAGTKSGIDEVIAFFDAMGSIMGKSGIQAEQLVMGANDSYAVEAQHVWTNREDGINLDHHWCVLWTFAGGKIIEGRHLAADQQVVDRFFNTVA